MDPILTQIITGIPVVGVMYFGLKWMGARYTEMDQKLTAAALACADREKALVQRVQSLEDARSSSLTQIVQSTMDALRLSASALHENSGAFRAMVDLKPRDHDDTETTALERRIHRKTPEQMS